MASIGSGWADGAWVVGAWVANPGAWASTSDPVAAATRGRYLPPRRGKPARPQYERRDEEKRQLEQVLESAYNELFGIELEPATTEAVRSAVMPVSRSTARKRLPRASTIDFAALAQNTALVERLLMLHERQLAMQDEEDAAIMLLLD